MWPVNFCVCPCHCVSSLIILPGRFLGDHVVFELQYSYKAREPWILAVHIPESTTPTIKVWFLPESPSWLSSLSSGHFVHA